MRTGDKITAFFRSIFHPSPKADGSRPEREPLLGQQKSINSPRDGAAIDTMNKHAPRIRDVLSYQTTLNLVVYTLLALYTLAFDQVGCDGYCVNSIINSSQLLPVFMHHPPQSTSDPNVSLPFKFSGGFGIDSRRIGAMFTLFAVTSTLCQFILFPPLARTLGVLRCLRIAFLIFPFVFFVTPFVSLIPNQTTKQIVMACLLVCRGIGGSFAFPTSTIMLTNSASSLRVLGTINGLATSVSAIGRAAGPAIGGELFTWGVSRGYVIVPFWTLSAISLLASIPTWWLVEGKGFGNSADMDAEESTSNTEEDTDEEGVGPLPIMEIDNASRFESEFGELGESAAILSFTSRRSSAAWVSENDDDDGDNLDEEAYDRERGLSSHLVDSQERRYRTVRKRSSVPIGMGRGFRRYSSNLGSAGIGASGTSWGGT